MRIPSPRGVLRLTKFAAVIAVETALFPLVAGASRLVPGAAEDVLRIQNRIRAVALTWLQPQLRQR